MGDVDVPKYTLSVIETVRSLQQLHGLKTYDYETYRQYCSRRLRRIHKTLRMFAGTMKKYKGLTIQPEDVTDIRVLEMLILQVERAWSYAEQLKYEYSNSDDLRKLRHCASRMAKAEYWATHLKDICTYVADERTLAEVTAYCTEMHAHRHMARKQYKEAKDKFAEVRKEYVKMQADSSTAVKAALVQRVTDIDQSIRYCTYNLGEEMQLGAGDDSGIGGTVLKWRDLKITVHSEKVRLLLASADTYAKEVATMAAQFEDSTTTGLNKFVDTYDKVFIAYNDALSQVRQDITQEKEGDPAMLRLLSNCLKYQLYEHTLRRNKVLTQVHTRRFENQETKQKKESGKRTTALDIARLHDTVNQTLESMLAIPGIEDDEAVADPLSLDLMVHTALRQHIQAEAFILMNEWQHAMPLYEAAEQEIGEAMAFALKRKLDDGEVRQASEKIRSAKCVCKAMLIKKGEESEGAEEQLKPCLDKHHKEYVACDEITKMPPDYLNMACRPIFLDVAGQMLPKPSIAHRAGDKQKGTKPSIKAEPSRPASADPASKEAEKGWFGGWGWGTKK